MRELLAQAALVLINLRMNFDAMFGSWHLAIQT